METVYGWLFRFIGSSVSSFLFCTFFREFVTKKGLEPTIEGMISGSGFITGLFTFGLAMVFMYIGKED